VKVGIVGQGYVGLPLAVEFAERGVDVIAVDVDPDKITCIQAGESYIEDVPPERLCAVRERIDATTRYAKLARADAIIICVPTPLTANREPELGPLRDCARALSEVLQAGQLIVLESTTFPGTTRRHLAPVLEESGLAVGRDFNLAFSPERVDPGRTDFTLRNTPKVVGGITDECGDRAEALYRTVCEEVVRVSTPEAAELTKLLENIFRSVNIALVNELAMLTDRMGIDIWEVIDAASTKPYGFMRFDPGPGMGGHCLPVDPFYLTWRAREFDLTPEFIELAGKVNAYMPVCPERKVKRCRRSFCDSCCASDGGRSSGFAVQAGSPNHRGVMPVKAGVGSDHGNGSLTAGQVCDEKTNMVEPLLTHRQTMTASQPGSVYIPGRASRHWSWCSQRAACVSLWWCSVLRWRELVVGVGVEQENLCLDTVGPDWMGAGDPWAARGRTLGGRNRLGQSTARRRGGPARSSAEGPVMGLERRGWAGQLTRMPTRFSGRN